MAFFFLFKKMVAFMQISNGFPKVSMPEIDMLCKLGLGRRPPHGSSLSELVKQCHVYIPSIDTPTSPRGQIEVLLPPGHQAFSWTSRSGVQHIFGPYDPPSGRVFELQLNLDAVDGN